MRILSVCGFSSYWGTDLPPDVLDRNEGKTVGGGEEASIRTALGLAELGHDVEFYWYGQPGQWRGLKFKGLYDGLYNQLADPGNEYDAVLGWSTLRPLEWAWPRKSDGKFPRRLFCQQLNDLSNPGDWSRIDAIVSPSANHAEQLPGWGWRERPYSVVHNGLDAYLYDQREWLSHRQNLRLRKVELDLPVNGHVRSEAEYKAEWDRITECEDALPYVGEQPAWKDRPLNVGYWSSPDRGLHHLLKAWPQVRAKLPEARLHVFYEIDRFLEFAVRCPGPLGDRARLLSVLVPRAKADSSITFHGAVPRNILRKTQIQTRVHCYPYQPVGYCEGFGTSVACGIAAGCHVMSTPHDAFPSLYGDAITWLPKEVEAMERELPNAIVRGLTDEKWSTARIAAAAPTRLKYTWDKAALEMEAACRGEGWKLTGPQ